MPAKDDAFEWKDFQTQISEWPMISFTFEARPQEADVNNDIYEADD